MIASCKFDILHATYISDVHYMLHIEFHFPYCECNSFYILHIHSAPHNTGFTYPCSTLHIAYHMFTHGRHDSCLKETTYCISHVTHGFHTYISYYILHITRTFHGEFHIFTARVRAATLGAVFACGGPAFSAPTHLCR